MIILDENIDSYWIRLLRSKNYDVLSIAEKYPGITDLEVISVVKKFKGILITEDKDFGELIFAHQISGISIIFLRYDEPLYHQIEKSLLYCLNKISFTHIRKFITITKHKIRIRNL